MDTRFKKGQPAWNKKEPIEKTCICGKKFYVKPSMDRLKSCSLACGTEARKGKSVFEGRKHTKESKKKMSMAKLGNGGSTHWNWKGGYSEAYRLRRSVQYEQWRKSVFERDEYTCKGCHIKGGYLTAHHIKSFAYFPNLRFEITNGITLCEPCHSATDNYKGRAKTKHLITTQ